MTTTTITNTKPKRQFLNLRNVSARKLEQMGLPSEYWEAIKAYRTKLPCLSDLGEFITSEPIVDARSLHKQLGIKEKFTEWLNRYTKFFTEGRDFVRVFENDLSDLTSEKLLPKNQKQVVTSENSLPKNQKQVSERNLGGAGMNKKDYLLTVDCAKHIAMMTRNDKGHAVREYFIKSEHVAKLLIEHNIEYNAQYLYEDVCAEYARILAKREYENAEANNKPNFKSLILVKERDIKRLTNILAFGEETTRVNRHALCEADQHKLNDTIKMMRGMMAGGLDLDKIAEIFNVSDYQTTTEERKAEHVNNGNTEVSDLDFTHGF